MEYLNLNYDQFKLFLLILTRVSMVLILFPILGSPVIPTIGKIGLALVLSMLLYNTVKIEIHSFPTTTVALVILIVSEMILGLILGLTVRLFFAGIQYAGQLIGFQMGFMMANVVDPLSGTSVSILEQVGYWAALLIFIMLNGHLIFILAMRDSFELVNIGWIYLPNSLYKLMMKLSADIFVIAIKIGSPAIAALLFTSVMFAVCAKFVPQMNILIVGFPVKITIGLFFFGICLHIIEIISRAYAGEFPMLLRALLLKMGGG